MMKDAIYIRPYQRRVTGPISRNSGLMSGNWSCNIREYELEALGSGSVTLLPSLQQNEAAAFLNFLETVVDLAPEGGEVSDSGPDCKNDHDDEAPFSEHAKWVFR